MKKELQQTKGSVKLMGQVVGLQNENTFREGVTKNGDGVPYRTASLGIKTSPTNVVYNLDTFGQVIEGRKVKVFSNKNNEKQTLEIDFKDRDNIPAGFTPFGFGTVSTSFEKDANGKAVRKNYFSYDGVKVIRDTLKEGESVWINGEFNPNTYVSNGETKTTVKYTMSSIGYLKKDIDFESENFKEVASFEQEMVIVNVDLDKESKKVYVTGRLIKYDKSWDDIVFVVDANSYEKLAVNVNKLLKFGDLVKVQGKIVNGVVLEEQKNDGGFDWGGESPQGVGTFVKNKISELQITNVVEHTKKVYKEEDFELDNAEDPFKDDGKTPFDTDTNDNPFGG